VVREHGRVTHVINNAGVALAGSCLEVSLEDIRWLMDINFWGVVFGTKFFLPFLEKEQSAHIVNVSSLYGLIAPPGQAAYSASKFAVRGFTEALRHELKGTNIAVSVVHPGGVKTNIANSARIGAGLKLSPEELQDRLDAVNLLLSHTTPEQAAEVIVKGIKGRNPRILIGRDARLLSLINRLFPCRYGDVIDRIRGGLFSNT
jgi:Short-chain dehydrogenases of various substrate specificities